jgi:hypothetical protein
MHRSTISGRKLRNSRRLSGLCIYCSKPSFAESYRCEKCLLRMSEYAMEKYTFRRAHSLCISCGNKAMRLKTRCQRCAIKYRVRLIPKTERKHALTALANFKNKCRICRAERPGGKGQWHLDHNHKTKKFRGILCARCNVVLGFVQDNPKLLMKLIRYLKTTP